MGKPKKKKPNTGRDYHMVGIIKGANKAYVEKDQKKEANKMGSRFWKKVLDDQNEEWADVENAKIKCTMCGFPFDLKGAKGDKDELAAMEHGYCSLSCMDYDTNHGVE